MHSVARRTSRRTSRRRARRSLWWPPSGSDQAGVRLRAMLEAIGADSSHGHRDQAADDDARRASSRARSRWCGSTRRTTATSPAKDVQRLLDTLLPLIAKADALVAGGLQQGRAGAGGDHGGDRGGARMRGIPSVVDPKFRNFFAYRGATIFKPNRRELESALGATVSLDDAGALPATLERLGVSTPAADVR